MYTFVDIKNLTTTSKFYPVENDRFHMTTGFFNSKALDNQIKTLKNDLSKYNIKDCSTNIGDNIKSQQTNSQPIKLKTKNININKNDNDNGKDNNNNIIKQDKASQPSMKRIIFSKDVASQDNKIFILNKEKRSSTLQPNNRKIKKLSETEKSNTSYNNSYLLKSNSFYDSKTKTNTQNKINNLNINNNINFNETSRTQNKFTSIERDKTTSPISFKTIKVMNKTGGHLLSKDYFSEKEIDYVYKKIFYKKIKEIDSKEEKIDEREIKRMKMLNIKRESNYIKDKIKDIKTKLLFMKGVVDYAYPVIFLEKIKMQKKYFDIKKEIMKIQKQKINDINMHKSSLNVANLYNSNNNNKRQSVVFKGSKSNNYIFTTNNDNKF
jgi:hypothetical protein